MWQLISGLIMIGIFFILFFMLKKGYDLKKEEAEKETGKNKK